MIRRLMWEEQPSQLAIWSRRFALFALAVACMAVFLVRAGFVETIPGVVILSLALAIAALGILLALAAFVVIWRNGNPGFRWALTAFLLGLAMLAYPTFVLARGYALPMLTDITTDTENPPPFEAAARLRPADANQLAYAGAEAARQQRAAYPDVVPLQLATSPADAYKAALAVVTKRKWTIIINRPPQAATPPSQAPRVAQGRTGRTSPPAARPAAVPTPPRDGYIEAVARTAVMGFRDDVAIRVKAAPGAEAGDGAAGAVVDVRSASRYGRSDLGTNAARIRSLLQDIDDQVANDVPPAAR